MLNRLIVTGFGRRAHGRRARSRVPPPRRTAVPVHPRLRRAAAQVRPRPGGFRSQRPAAGRPVPVRRRRLARQHRDSGGPLELRLVHHPRRPGAGRGEAAHRRRVRTAEPARRAPTRRKWATSISPTWTRRESRAWGWRRSRTSWRASTRSPPRATSRATSAARSASASRSRSHGSRRPTRTIRPMYLGALYQNGLTMPDRDYYLSPDEKYAQLPREVRRVRRADAGARRGTQCALGRRAHRRARDAHR